MRSKYYSLAPILAKEAMYNVIIGERSNGKTYASLKYGIEQYAKRGSQIALLRRWQDDFKGKRAASMFDALVKNGEISRATNGEWTDVYYYAGRWFLCKYEGDDRKRIRVTDTDPFCYAFALSSMEHDKSTSYPDIRTIIFDEFITRTAYLGGMEGSEFVIFMNVLSTIIRDRNDVKIFMLGNTVSKSCPYFKEMGLTHVKNQKPGTIELYHYGNSNLTVAVEFCKPNAQGKASDDYFSFDNPRLQMITGKGNVWEIAVYPHCPIKYKPKDVVFRYFIQYDGEMLEAEIINVGESVFTFIHRKTTPIKNPDEDLIYTPDYDPRPNWKRRLTVPTTPIEKTIANFFRRDKVYYQDNEVGEIVRNYLMWSATSSD